MDKYSFGIPNTEPGGILIALRFVLVVKPRDKRTSQNPVIIICFYTLLLEVSQHGVGACRDFTEPLATPFPSVSLRRALRSHALVQGGRDKGCICFMTH